MAQSESTQLFPPALKWACLGFFTVIGISIVAVLTFSPQILTRNIQSLSIEEAEPTKLTPTPPEQTKRLSTASANIMPSPSTQTETINSESAVESTPSPTINATPKSVAQEPEGHCHYSGSSEPKIIGIKVKGHKFYFTPGDQLYLMMERRQTVSQKFCTKQEAENLGWQRGPSNKKQMNELRQPKDRGTKEAQKGSDKNLLRYVFDLLLR